jgi:hypothetical protein
VVAREGDRSDVADREDLGAARDRELGADADAIASLEVQSERMDELIALQACTPHQRVRGDERRPQRDLARGAVRAGGVVDDVDAQP